MISLRKDWFLGESERFIEFIADVFLKALTVHASYPEDEASECAVTRTELYTGEYPDIVAIDVFEEIM